MSGDIAVKFKALCDSKNLEGLKELSKDSRTDFSVTLSETAGNIFHFCVDSYNGTGSKITAIFDGLKELAGSTTPLAKNLQTKNPTVIQALAVYNKNEETPLHIAARRGHLHIVMKLVALGADTQQICTSGGNHMTAEEWARFHKRDEVATYLANLRHECDVRECLRDGELVKAKTFHLDEIQKKKTSEEITQLVTSQDPLTGDTLLILAIRSKDGVSRNEDGIIEVLKILVSLGGNIHQENKAHETVLLLAIQYRYLKVFNYLVNESGLLPPQIDRLKNPILFEFFNVRDEKNRAFLERFAEFPTTDFTIRSLTEHVNIFHACATNHAMKRLTALITGLGRLERPNPKVKEALCQRSPQDFTPLHAGACLGHLDIVTLLVEKLDADWSLSSNEGTPEEVAVKHGRKDVAEFLKTLRHKKSLFECLKDGAFDDARRFHINPMLEKQITTEEFKKRVEEKDSSTGDTSLLALLGLGFRVATAESEILRLVHVLIEAGTNPNTTNMEGHSPLFLAFLCGYRKVFNYLLSKADLDLLDANKNTLLHKLAGCPRDKIDMLTTLLIRKPAMLKAENEYKQTPLFEVDDPDVLEFFIKKGAPSKAQDIHGHGIERYFLTRPSRILLLQKLRVFHPDSKLDQLLSELESPSDQAKRVMLAGGHAVASTAGNLGQSGLDLISGTATAIGQSGKLLGNTIYSIAEGNLKSKWGKKEDKS